MLAAPLLAAALLAAPPTADGPIPPPKDEWSQVLRISRAHGEVEALTEVMRKLVLPPRSIDERVVGKLLKQLTQFIDSEVTTHGEVLVSVGMLVDAIDAVERARWSDEDAARFVIAMQRDLNAGRRDETRRLQETIERVRRGDRLEQLVSADDHLKAAERR